MITAPVATLKDLLEKNGDRVLTLEEIQGVNLNDPWFPSSRLEKLIISKPNGNRFMLWHPWMVDSYLHPETNSLHHDELSDIEQRLRQRGSFYKVTHYPPFYDKDQGDWWTADIELDLSIWFSSTVITLVEFGSSYGTIAINGIEVRISHSGGTHAKYGAVDNTYGFHLAGPTKVKALQSIIECAKQPWYRI